MLKKTVFCSVFWILGMVIGFCLRPSINSRNYWEAMHPMPTTNQEREYPDAKLPISMILLYVGNADGVLTSFINQNLLDLNEFHNQNEAYEYLRSVFNKSIWYPIVDGILFLALTFLFINFGLNKKYLILNFSLMVIFVLFLS